MALLNCNGGSVLQEVGVRFLPEELCFGEGEKTGEDEKVKFFEK